MSKDLNFVSITGVVDKVEGNKLNIAVSKRIWLDDEDKQTTNIKYFSVYVPYVYRKIEKGVRVAISGSLDFIDGNICVKADEYIIV